MTTVFSSWTIWFGIVQCLLGVIGLISGQLGQSESITLITTGIGTIGLRFKTTTPII